MAELKTKQNDGNVAAYIESVSHPQRRLDAKDLLSLFERITSSPAKMWGDSMIGFGKYQYQGKASKGEWFMTGFAPRKQNLAIYIMPGFDEYDKLLAQLGKYKTGKSCLYINKLSDIDLDVLASLISQAYGWMKSKYGE